MGAFLYRLTIRLSRVFGYGPLRAFAWCVSTAYFLFFPDRVRTSIDFYGALFPGTTRAERRRLAWRQFHRFAAGYADRLRAANGEPIEFREAGGELLQETIAGGSGAVVVSSHLGYWELAAIMMMKKYHPQLMLYVGEREEKQLERTHKADLRNAGVEIVSVNAATATPFDLLDAVHFVRRGGIAAIAGDRIWSPQQQTTDVEFLGRTARLPAAPFVLAQLCRAPLFAVFMTRDEGGPFVLNFSRLEAAAGEARADRDRATQQIAQGYADRLAATARERPTNWFHFERFIGPPRP